MDHETMPTADWIYSLADYKKIFELTDEDLKKQIVIYPGGISSVNAELFALGCQAVSIDALYKISPVDMAEKAHQLLNEKIKQMQDNVTPIVMDEWQDNVQKFLQDYQSSSRKDHYITIEEVKNPTEDRPFELLLCTQYGAPEWINQLCELATEVRVFSLPDEKSSIQSELGPMMLDFQQRNFGVEVRAVDSLIQNQGTAMLRIWAKECGIH